MSRPPIFVYDPRCIDGDVQAPPSPTSSVKGLFARSRPVSYAPSECPTIASECLTISAYNSDSSDYTTDVSTPATSTAHDAIYTSFKPRPSAMQMQPPRLITEDELHVRLTQPRVVSEEAYYARLSGRETTTITPDEKLSHERSFDARSVRFVRSSDTQMHMPDSLLVVQQPDLDDQRDTPGKPKRRGWHAIRRTVSHILRRQPKDKDSTTPTPLSASHIATPSSSISSPRSLKPSKSGPLKPSSASLFSKHSRRSDKRLTVTPPARAFDEQQAQSRARKQQVRRSRSFSGFPNVLAAITDEGTDGDNDSGLDEVTREAQVLAREIRKTWAFGPLNVDDPSILAEDLLFERGVEQL
ncbi:hypothetical protein DXG01_016812 [Tephrocybe rancida]|nr:hypothetical protein DXG01_016812 [Tephrocybe rancida]